MLSDPETATIALVIQAALTGLQFTTFFLCLRWLIFSDYDWTPRKHIKWSMLIVTVLLISLSTTILGLTLQSALFYVKDGNGLLPAATVSVRDLPAQTYRHFPDLVAVRRCSKLRSGDSNGHHSGSSIVALIDLCSQHVSDLSLLGGLQQMVAHRSFPCSPMAIQLLEHYRCRVYYCIWWRKNTGITLDPDLL